MACFIHNSLPLLSSSFLQKSRQFAEATASAASPAGASTPANLAGHGLPGCCTGGRPRHNEVQIKKKSNEPFESPLFYISMCIFGLNDFEHRSSQSCKDYES